MKDYYPENIGRSLNSNAALSWEVIKGLTARSELGLSNYWNKSKTWSGATYRDYLDPATGTKLFGGDAALSSSEGWNIRWVNTLSYNVQGLGNNHTLNLMAGHEVTNSGSSSINISGNKYPASFESERAFAMMDQYFRDPAVTNYSFSSNTGTPNRLISFFGRANYSLLNRYLLTATFRADGSSRFSPAHRWGYFPAAALGWRISEESFMKDISWISTLKLRASYGSVGNDGISANLWKSQWNSNGLSSYSLNEVRQVSYSPQATISNPDLKWETTITRNIGIDFAFLKSRIFGTLDFYKNSTKDLLMLTNVTAISGSTATYANIGSTSNKGIEFAIGGDIVRSKDFTLSANININMNRGNVEELAPGVNGLYNTNFASTYIAPTYDYILVEGKPVGQVRGYTYDGWYTVDDFDYNPTTKIYTLKAGVPDVAVTMGTIHGTNTNKPGGQVAYPGVIKLKDISGPAGVPDGVVNDFDVSIIGDMNPKHTGGFNINGMYKGIDLGLNFNWSYGNKIYNANYLAALFGSKQDGLYRNRLDVLAGSYKIYEIVDGQLSFVTDPDKLNALNADATIYMPFQENVVVSTLGVQDGSFLRLNNVTLGYTLPKNLSEKVKISKLRVYGSIYNAMTFTKYLGLDPEVNTNTSQGNARYPTTGLDWGSYPRARSFTLGLNIEF
jgi:TonB-linked SusC/RagA family outer membrane protein